MSHLFSRNGDKRSDSRGKKIFLVINSMYYDLLVRIKNAIRARKKIVRLPFSNMDFSVAKKLSEAGYLREVKKKVVEKKTFLELELVSKNRDREQVMVDFKVISKPGRRMYIGYQSLRSVKQGYGIGVLSTPQGILTNREARKNKVGGEYLFEVW